MSCRAKAQQDMKREMVAAPYFIRFLAMLQIDDERLFSREIKGLWSLNKVRLHRKITLRYSLMLYESHEMCLQSINRSGCGYPPPLPC